MQEPSSARGATTGDELKSDAKHLGSSVADRIHGEVDARKSMAVDQAKAVSSAIDRAAGNMDEGAPEWIRSALRQGAQKIQSFADSIEGQSSREMVSNAQDFARANPASFLAACFAAARIVKAGSGSASGAPSQGHSAGQSTSSAEPKSALPDEDAAKGAGVGSFA